MAQNTVHEIMCTLTAKQICEHKDLVVDLYRAGMRSVRINTAHLDGVDQLHLLCTTLKSLLPDIRILIDTKGPEMRTTAIADDGTVCLTEGMEVCVSADGSDHVTDASHIYVNYPQIHTEVTEGDRLLIDDGRIALTVSGVDGDEIKAVVTVGGLLGSKKGMSVQGKDLDLPAVSHRDAMFISYAATAPEIDEIAHSFVRSAADVMEVRRVMDGGVKPVIAKIENQQGIDHLDEIIAVSDGILIARGDLTASIGSEAIPQAQALIAAAAKRAGRRLYLATNILPSMMTSPQPSLHDIEGIATALDQGVDVLLLTNETAAGAYPLESVTTLTSLLL